MRGTKGHPPDSRLRDCVAIPFRHCEPFGRLRAGFARQSICFQCLMRLRHNLENRNPEGRHQGSVEPVWSLCLAFWIPHQVRNDSISKTLIPRCLGRGSSLGVRVITQAVVFASAFYGQREGLFAQCVGFHKQLIQSKADSLKESALSLVKRKYSVSFA